MKFPHFHTKKQRNYASTSLMIFTWSIGGGALWFLLPKITKDLTGSLLTAGLLVSFSSLTSLFFDIPIGKLTNKTSGKKLIILGLLMLGLTGLMLPYIKTIAFMLVFLFLIGVFFQVIYVPAVAYIITSVKKEEASEYMAASMTSLSMGYAIGPVLLGLLLGYLQKSEAQLTGLFLTVMCFISIVPALALLEDVKPHPQIRQLKRKLKAGRQLLKQVFDFHHLKQVGFTLLYVTFLLSFYDGMVWMLEPVYGFKLNLSPVYIGLLLSAFTLPLILFQVPAGILADRYGRKKLMTLGLIVAGLSTILFGFETNHAYMIVHAFIATVGIALAWPAVDGLVSELDDGEETGVIAGVWSSARDLGYVLGPALGAFIAYYLQGIGNAFVLVGFGLILSVFVITPFMKKH